MSSLGTLTYDIIAKIGGFTAGMTEAERAASKSAKQIEASLKSISVTGVAVGTALGTLLADGIIAAANAFPQLINNIAKFQDLAEETGASAEGLAGFAVAAATAGVSMESVAGATIKLTKNLIGVDDESKAAGAALGALGIKVDEFKKLDPAAQYEAVGKALAGFADAATSGANKTAVAVLLFGKAGAEQLKVMKALEEQGGRSNILTKEQIKLADDYADKTAKLKAEIGLYAAAIVADALPALNELSKYALQAAKELFGLGGSSTELGKNTGVRDFAQDAAVKIAGFIDGIGNAVQAVGTLIRASQAVGTSLRLAGEALATPISGPVNVFQGKGYLDNVKEAYANNQDAFNKLSQSFTATVDRAKKREGKSLRELFDQQNREAADPETQRLLARARAANQLPDLKYGGPTKTAGGGRKGGGATDDPTKKLLENELANFKAMGDQAKEQLADRNRILDLYNQQGLLSVKDYYSGLKSAQDDATAAQAQALDDQIASLEKYKAAAAKDTDVADTQGKINKLTEEKAKLYRQAGIEAIAMGVKEQEAAKAVKAAFDEVNAKVFEFQGNMRAAAEIRFDASNQKLIAQATAENNTEILKQIELLKGLELGQASINKAQKEFSLAQGDLQIAEERITIARERGTMGEIESLKASGQARQEAVALMERHLAALLAINDAARSPEQVQQIERLKVQLEGLKATIDPLADKFNTMFGDALGNAFGDVITGAKSAKDAFKDFANAVISDIGRMVAKDLAKSLFSGASESGFNIGSMLSSLFGGATAKSAAEKSANATGGDDILGAFISKLGLGGAASGAAVSSANTAMATSATAASTALAALTTAASSAATAMAASAVGGAGVGSALGSLASSLAGANAVGSSGGDALGALIKLQGWSSGGFTGMGAANDPAGIVHKGEYVLDQETTRRLGVANLNRMNAGGIAGGFSQVNNFTVPGRIDRHTETHLAQEVRRQTLTAAGRF